MIRTTPFLLLSLLIFGCTTPPNPAKTPASQTQTQLHTRPIPFDTSRRTAHVFVALCDNKHQGIIPVPAAIGNGQDPNSNLYWGCDDGLMDFRLINDFQPADTLRRDAVILACISKKYFAPFLHSSGATPLVWTTGLMCPEAYTLHDALRSYLNGESRQQIRLSAATAYNRNQRCGDKAAQNLLVEGW